LARLNQTPPDRAGRYNEFLSDPAHPVSDSYTTYGAHDYRALDGRKDVLVYDSDPLLVDTEVTGPIHAEIFVSADVPDVDLWVRLLDVAPDGTAFTLMSPGLDVLRASYRNEKPQPELLKPGEIYKLNLDRMLTSNVFRAGHQIRIQISGAFFPHFSRSLQSGESEITSSKMCTARVRIYHEPDHPSRIELPVIPQ
jgi:putative CocE/NonD family hydrolase